MALHVLVPYDDSEPAEAALEHAVSQFPDAEITVLVVADQSEVAPVPAGLADETPGDVMAEEVEDSAASAKSVAPDGGDRITTEFRGGAPANEIVDYVEEAEVNHVVIGTEGRSGVSRVLMGSVAENVVRHSPVPVTTVQAE